MHRFLVDSVQFKIPEVSIQKKVTTTQIPSCIQLKPQGTWNLKNSRGELHVLATRRHCLANIISLRKNCSFHLWKRVLYYEETLGFPDVS